MALPPGDATSGTNLPLSQLVHLAVEAGCSTKVTTITLLSGKGPAGKTVKAAPAAIMAAFAMVESGGNAQAHNASSDARGLWQILGPSVHPEFAAYNLYDPTENAKAMAILSNKGTNAQAWYPNEPTDAYKQYMPDAGGLASSDNQTGATGLGKAADQVSGAVGGALDSVDAGWDAIKGFIGVLESGALWKRIGIVAVGVIFMIVAVIFMFEDKGKGPTASGVTEPAAAEATKAAMEA